MVEDTGNRIMCPFLIEKLRLRHRALPPGKQRWEPLIIYGQDLEGKCKYKNDASAFLCCHAVMSVKLRMNHRRDFQVALAKGFVEVVQQVGGQRAEGARVGLQELITRHEDFLPAQQLMRRIERTLPNWRP